MYSSTGVFFSIRKRSGNWVKREIGEETGLEKLARSFRSLETKVDLVNRGFKY